MSPPPVQPLRPLIFDLDGTLIDSRFDIAAAANFALKITGRRELSVPEICRFVGSGAQYLLTNVSGDQATGDELDVLLRYFMEYYLGHPTDHSAALPGADAALREGARRKAICTNKPREITARILANLAWDELVTTWVGSGDFQKKKPDPEALLLLAERLGVAPHELIMIGDSPQDILAGKAVGGHAILVLGGFVSENEGRAAGPHGVLRSLEELPEYLRERGL